MTFLAPAAFWLLALLPCLVFSYLLLIRRKRQAFRYASLRLVIAAMSPSGARRRHVPAALLLLCLAASVFAMARPTKVIDTPARERTIILAIDVSTSMATNDVAPSRFAAARAAATAFISSQPPGVRIGIVAFAGHADLLHPPSRDHQEAIAALERLHLQHDTSIGVGLISSLLTLFPDENLAGHLDLFGVGRSPVGLVTRHGDGAGTGVAAGAVDAPHARGAMERRSPGSHPSAAIILLTDGRDTMGPRADKGATLAVERGVRVYTVGLGRASGRPGPDGMPTGVDVQALQSIAERTRGEYFHAATARDLQGVYRNLQGRMVLSRVDTELTAVAAAVASLLLVLAGMLSFSWSPRSVGPAAPGAVLRTPGVPPLSTAGRAAARAT